MGRALYRLQNTHEPIQCTLNTSFNKCPENFYCQSSVTSVMQGYCCSSQGKFKYGKHFLIFLDVCKNGGKFLINEKTQIPKICIMGLYNSCDKGYSCYKSPTSSIAYCCKEEDIYTTGI